MRNYFAVTGRAGCLIGIAFVGACGGSSRPRPVVVGPWVLQTESVAYLDYRADEQAGLEVPELQPAKFDENAVAAARGVAIAPPIIAPGICTFPAVYDLRTLGRVTPARDSTAVCGTCWTSAAVGSIESIVAPFELRDFSEAHMQLLHGADTAACGQGGNRNIATFYLAAWRGPVDEADFDPGAPPIVRGTQQPVVQKHVQNVPYLPNRNGPLDNCLIKLAVTNFGGVYSDIGRSDFSPHFTVNNAYYHPTAGTVHSVTIVGWDDNFDRNQFFCGDPKIADTLRVPAGDGAFIVKDNGGPGWRDQGFFYVSYYDGSIGTGMASYQAEPLGNYTRNYQHDPYGPTNYLSLPGQQKAASWQANVFTAAEDEWLAAVSFYELTDNNMDYQVQIYLDPNAGPVAAGGPAATAQVSLIMRGYYTVKLPQRVRVNKGQRFSVVLRGQDRTGGWPSAISIEQPDPFHTKVNAGPGESFVSADGTTWQDLTGVQIPKAGGLTETLANTNVCIKAFTTPLIEAGAQLVSDDMSMTWQIANDGPEDLWVKPVARLFQKAGDELREFGDQVEAAYVQYGNGGTEDTFDGWILVPPGEQVTALAQAGSIAGADEVAYKVLYLESVAGLIRSSAVWKYLLNLFLQQPLQVVSTNPGSGATVNSPGSNVITVTFDKVIKPGPNLQGVTVTAGSTVYSAGTSVSGNQLTIYTAPVTTKDLGGTQVEVRIPSHAVLSQLGSNPLASDYVWSYVVTGVN